MPEYEGDTAQRFEGRAFRWALQGFAQGQQTKPGDDPADDESPENAAPGAEGQQKAPQDGRDHGRDKHHGLNGGKHVFHGAAPEHVLGDGHGHGADGTAACRLNDASADEHPDVGGKRAHHAGEEIQRQSGQNDGTPAVFVAERPPDQHGQREEEHEAHQRQVGKPRRCLKVFRHDGQGGKKKIGGKRSEGAEEGEIDNKSLPSEPVGRAGIKGAVGIHGEVSLQSGAPRRNSGGPGRGDGHARHDRGTILVLSVYKIAGAACQSGNDGKTLQKITAARA